MVTITIGKGEQVQIVMRIRAEPAGMARMAIHKESQTDIGELSFEPSQERIYHDSSFSEFICVYFCAIVDFGMRPSNWL